MQWRLSTNSALHARHQQTQLLAGGHCRVHSVDDLTLENHGES
jgi:hypothetical protein